MSLKKRLDILIMEKGLETSRERAKAMIMAGKAFVNGEKSDKPGRIFSIYDEIILKKDDINYVSRGGIKLYEAINTFKIDVKDLLCIDIGASTGGFTDCLLQCGAKHVFAIDVGYGQFAWKLRQDKRVTLFERTNIRYLKKEAIPYFLDIAVIDVSFISLKIVLPAVLKFLKQDSNIIALIKPQFEAGRDKVGKGVIKDPRIHSEVLKSLIKFFKEQELICKRLISSPVLGPKGNKEFLIYIKKKLSSPLIDGGLRGEL